MQIKLKEFQHKHAHGQTNGKHNCHSIHIHFRFLSTELLQYLLTCFNFKQVDLCVSNHNYFFYLFKFLRFYLHLYFLFFTRAHKCAVKKKTIVIYNETGGCWKE